MKRRYFPERGLFLPAAPPSPRYYLQHRVDLMDEFEMLQKAEIYAGIKAFDIKRYFDETLK